MYTDNMNKIILSKCNQSEIILGKIILSENGSVFSSGNNSHVIAIVTEFSVLFKTRYSST